MLCAKFAPWLVDGVIENSGGAQMLWWHSGVGKEVDFTKFIELSPIYTYANLAIYTSTRSFWTLDESSPNYFSPERKAIRELLHKEHLSTQAHYAKPLYTCYHCKFDTIASFEAKSKLVKELENLGFNVDFKAIIDESQVDKKFIQNLSHGMDIPLKMLIEKELFVMLERLKKHKKTKCAKSISYACGNLLYTFYEEKGQMQLKIERTK